MSIYVTIAGPAPAGAAEATASVVASLKTASGLDLEIGDSTLTAAQTITIRFAPKGTIFGDLRLDDDTELGVGGPTWSPDTGVINHGEVLIRSDTSLTDPRTPPGRHVLMHELGHALGLGHSAPALPEVMAPESGPGDVPTLGPGDLHALTVIGCPGQ